MQTIKIVNCKDCPLKGRTEFAERAVNYGCLPAPYDALKWFNDTGRVWACHAQPNKACGSVLEMLMKQGKTVDFSQPLITEHTQIYDEKGNVVLIEHINLGVLKSCIDQ